MSYTKTEVKSGFFILFAIAALLVMTFIVGGMQGGKKVSYKVRFGYVGGLEKGAPVYFAGREVGKVTSLNVENGEDRPIVITIDTPENLVIRADSRATIDTLGMMGEKLLEISPGTKTQAALQPGSTMEGVDAISMYEMIHNLSVLSESLNPMVETLNGIMQRNSQTIEELLVHVNGTTKGLDKMLNGNQEQIAKIIGNLEETSSNVRDMTADLKKRPWRLVRKG